MHALKSSVLNFMPIGFVLGLVLGCSASENDNTGSPPGSGGTSAKTTAQEEGGSSAKPSASSARGASPARGGNSARASSAASPNATGNACALGQPCPTTSVNCTTANGKTCSCVDGVAKFCN